MGGMSRPPGAIPPPHPAGGVATGVGPNQGSGPPPGYLANQQQAVMMKKMAMEQGKRAQMQMMEQHRKQQLLAEQVSWGGRWRAGSRSAGIICHALKDDACLRLVCSCIHPSASAALTGAANPLLVLTAVWLHV